MKRLMVVLFGCSLGLSAQSIMLPKPVANSPHGTRNPGYFAQGYTLQKPPVWISPSRPQPSSYFIGHRISRKAKSQYPKVNYSNFYAGGPIWPVAVNQGLPFCPGEWWLRDLIVSRYRVRP